MAHDSIVAEQSIATTDAENVHLLEIAWRRKWLLVIGATVGLMVGALYYAQESPVYESMAEVLVIKKGTASATTQGLSAQTFVDNYVAAHVTLIKSPLIIQRAVADGQLGALPGFSGADNAAVQIGESLIVEGGQPDSVGSSTNILNLSFQGTDPDVCQRVLDAVIASYQSFLDETYEHFNENTLTLITTKAEEFLRQLQKKEREYRVFRQTIPLLQKGKEGGSFSEDRLTAIEAERSALRIRRAKAESRLETIRQALHNGEDRQQLLAMVSQWTRDASAHPSGDDTADQRVFPLLLEENLLLQRFGARHPKVRSVQQQIALVRKFWGGFPDLAGDAAGPNSDAERSDPLQAHVELLEREIKELKSLDGTLEKLFRQEYEDTRKLTDYEFGDSQFRSEIARAQQFYDGLMTQLQGINFGKDMGGYVTSVITPAGLGVLVEPKLSRILPVGLFLGLLAGMSLAYWVEISDKSFRTPEEIRDSLNLPVVGHIPFFQADEAAAEAGVDDGIPLDPLLCTHFEPKSPEAEAYRVVRTALYFNTRGQGHKVIQVTSPDQRDGKTTLSANLAITIAQSGKRVALLDADFRKPRQHSLFGVSNAVGLASLLTGTAEPHEVIQDTAIHGLSVVPCGPLPPNPAELLTSPRFGEFLDFIRDRCDFVLIDTPPVLAVTDPGVVAANVDGVLLVIRVKKNARPHAAHAKETLQALGANLFGVVVNGYQQDSHRYGRGYGYGYRYGYSYGYEYGDHSREDEETVRSEQEHPLMHEDFTG